jgi:hypothetical protein
MFIVCFPIHYHSPHLTCERLLCASIEPVKSGGCCLFVHKCNFLLHVLPKCRETEVYLVIAQKDQNVQQLSLIIHLFSSISLSESNFCGGGGGGRWFNQQVIT